MCNLFKPLYDSRNVLILNFIKDRISSFGDLPLCNLVKERGFFIGEFCFPFCVRCTAIILCTITTIIIIQVLKIRLNKRAILFGIISLLPCLIDGLMQYCFGIESTNVRRLITGIFCGIGTGVLICYFYDFFIKKLKLIK